MAPQQALQARSANAQPAGPKKAFDPCVWGYFRGEQVSVGAYKDRVYVAVRQMSRDGRPTRARIGLDAQTCRKLIAVLVAEYRKAANHSCDEELQLVGQRPPAPSGDECGECGEHNGHAPECPTANYIR